MRQECKNFESRTYGNGETVRKCNLDLAPDAPWRCPEKCSAFEPRMDAGWTYGSVFARCPGAAKPMGCCRPAASRIAAGVTSRAYHSLYLQVESSYGQDLCDYVTT